MSLQYPINVYKDVLRDSELYETLANMTYNYQWPAVLDMLRQHPHLVNTARRG